MGRQPRHADDELHRDRGGLVAGVTCALAMMVLGVGTASASTLTFDGRRTAFTAPPGEVNHVRVEASGTPVQWQETGELNYVLTELGCSPTAVAAGILSSRTGHADSRLSVLGTRPLPRSQHRGPWLGCCRP